MEISRASFQAIREARKSRGESQEDLAHRVGLSRETVAGIESGEGALNEFILVCKALGVRLEVKLGERTETLVFPLDPEERREIEANIDWFSRLEPAERLRTMARHLESARRLREAGLRGHGR